MAHRSQPININRCRGGVNKMKVQKYWKWTYNILVWGREEVNKTKVQKYWKWTYNISVGGRGMLSFWFETSISASANFTTLSTGPLSVDVQKVLNGFQVGSISLTVQKFTHASTASRLLESCESISTICGLFLCNSALPALDFVKMLYTISTLWHKLLVISPKHYEYNNRTVIMKKTFTVPYDLIVDNWVLAN